MFRQKVKISSLFTDELFTAKVCGAASELTKAKMASPMFCNLPPHGYNFLGCTRRGGGLTQVALC